MTQQPPADDERLEEERARCRARQWTRTVTWIAGPAGALPKGRFSVISTTVVPAFFAKKRRTSRFGAPGTSDSTSLRRMPSGARMLSSTCVGIQRNPVPERFASANTRREPTARSNVLPSSSACTTTRVAIASNGSDDGIFDFPSSGTIGSIDGTSVRSSIVVGRRRVVGASAAGGFALPDEAIHLAAAVQTAGYRHVIAALWSVSDNLAPAVAETVYRSLVERGAIGLITTHDLALAGIADELAPKAANVHFEDFVEDGKIHFDYRMRPGIVRKSNAIELMRSVGLEV